MRILRPIDFAPHHQTPSKEISLPGVERSINWLIHCRNSPLECQSSTVLRVHVRKMGICDRQRVAILVCHRCKRSDEKRIDTEGSSSATSTEDSRNDDSICDGSQFEARIACRALAAIQGAKHGNFGHELSRSLNHPISGKTGTEFVFQDPAEETKDQVVTSGGFRYRQVLWCGEGVRPKTITSVCQD